MSSAFFGRLLGAVLAAGSLCCAAGALAKAGSLENLLAGQLTASEPAPLLGPITSAGRTGWDCKPERAAAATQWHAADLPAGHPTP